MKIDQVTAPHYGVIGGGALIFICICALGTFLAVSDPVLIDIEKATFFENG
jgi:hypothetical protein